MKPIGVIDSGVGGTTVLAALRRALPRENFVYLADHALHPFGTRTDEELSRIAVDCADLLAQDGLRALVLACNTLSAVSQEQLSKRFDFPVVGMIRAGAELLSTADYAVVLCTRATKMSGRHRDELQRIGFSGSLQVIDCDWLIRAIERGAPALELQHEVNLVTSRVDSRRYQALLACTHLPLAELQFREATPEGCSFVDPAARVAEQLKALLPSAHDAGKEPGRTRWMTTGEPRMLTLRLKTLGLDVLVEPVEWAA